MKKMILALAVLGMAALGASTAHAGVRFSIGIPAPVIAVRAPVYYAPPPVVYVRPAPVLVAPPVYAAPIVVAPRVVVAPPVVYAPVPVVRFGLGLHLHRLYRHGCW
ncbi:MAG TPA: hypothetical protein VN873_06660 [Candidatus Angelobacter sp.]|nr:hypothetical protein [Candidatus Angelobacter sp.]